MRTLVEGTKPTLRFIPGISGTIVCRAIVRNSFSVGRHTCLVAGAAGKLRVDLFSLKANGILVIDFRQSRIGTHEQSQFASLLLAH